MKNNSLSFGKKIALAFTAALMITLLSITAFAETAEKNYEIPDCRWNQTETSVKAEWEKTESSTSYDITLYFTKSNKKNAKKILNVSTTGTSYDFTDTVLLNGQGEYKFFVKPKKGTRQDGKESDPLEIDNLYINSAKKAVKEIKKSEDPYYDKSYTEDGKIKSVAVKCSEGSVPDGQMKQMNVVSAGSCTVLSSSIDLPYEQWTEGVPRKLTVVLQANDGLEFTNDTEFTGKLLTYLSNSGDTKTRTVEFSFTPRIKLEKVTGLYLDANNVLRWNRVPYADYYYVTIKDSSTAALVNKKVRAIKLDISDIIDDIATVQMYASGGKPCYIKSDTLKIDNFDEFRKTGQLTGRWVKTGSSVMYEGENGEYLKGWQQLAGSWYYFDEKGKAVGPGWWQDKFTPDDPNRAKGGSWYYFDNDHRMLANTTTPDGYRLDEHGRWVQ